MRTIRYRDALREAMLEEMTHDERVFVMGEEVGHYQGAYKVTQGLLDAFGERRVVDAPIAEGGFAGLGIGAAMVGLKPIIEFMTWNFSFVAFDQIVSNASKIYQMSGGTIPVPVVFRGPNGAARQVAAQHSHSVDSIYAHFPGLKVVMPSTPRDAKGLLKTAIRHETNPVLVLEGETLYGMKGEIPEDEEFVPFGKARIGREGADVTIVAWGSAYFEALAAAERLAQETGLEAEIVDPRCLRPLDLDTLVSSVQKTHRCVVVHEHLPYGGVGAEIVDQIQRHAFDALDAPIVRVGALDMPMPYASNLESQVLPTVDRVFEALKTVCYVG